MLAPAIRTDGEVYATVDQILACADIAEADVRVPWWRNAAGEPYLIRVRGLDFPTEQAIDRAATRKDGSQDSVMFVLGVLEHGIRSPSFDKGQISLIKRKNPYALRQLADFIQILNTLRPDEIAAWVSELADLDASEDAEPGADETTDDAEGDLD